MYVSRWCNMHVPFHTIAASSLNVCIKCWIYVGWHLAKLWGHEYEFTEGRLCKDGRVKAVWFITKNWNITLNGWTEWETIFTTRQTWITWLSCTFVKTSKSFFFKKIVIHVAEKIRDSLLLKTLHFAWRGKPWGLFETLMTRWDQLKDHLPVDLFTLVLLDDYITCWELTHYLLFV